MKLSQLVENMIRVPEELEKKAVGEVLSAYYSFYLGYLGKDKMQDIEALAKKYDRYDLKPVMSFVDNTFNGKLAKRISYSDYSVNPRYKSKKSKPKTIMLMVEFGDMNTHDAIIYSGKYMSHKLHVNFRGIITPQAISSAKRNVRSINDEVPYLISTVKHELQHVIQFDYLGHKNKQMHPEESTTDLDLDAYYQHPIEFSPVIETNIGLFRSIVSSHNRQSDTPLSRREIMELAKLYVNPEYKSKLKVYYKGNLVPAQHSAYLSIPSSSFSSLFYKNKNKWKKAVKAFFHGLNLN